jgi:hypothetical protein
VPRLGGVGGWPASGASTLLLLVTGAQPGREWPQMAAIGLTAGTSYDDLRCIRAGFSCWTALCIVPPDPRSGFTAVLAVSDRLFHQCLQLHDASTHAGLQATVAALTGVPSP